MKRRAVWILSVALCLALLIAAAPMAASAAESDGVKYIDDKSNEQTCASATAVTADDTTWSGSGTDGGWYVVNGNVTIGTEESPQRVTVNGNVHLILADRCSLTVTGGINVSEGNSLTIYAQSTNEEVMGKLTANGTGGDAGIGPNATSSSSVGSITINGGSINAAGRDNNVGIGGKNITINGGTITATGDHDAGIGGIFSTITINGGTVNAAAGSSSAGIGGRGPSGGTATITINGGNVKARGGGKTGMLTTSGAGIGGKDGVKIVITGGYITATGGSNNGYNATIAAGIGGHSGNKVASIEISGGIIYAYGEAQTGIGKAQSFSTGTNGNAIIFSDGFNECEDADDTSNWSGIIFNGSSGQVYGGDKTVSEDLTIPEGKTLTIPIGTTLTISDGVTISNSGTLKIDGTVIVGSGGTLDCSDGQINVTGTLTNNGTFNKAEQTAPEAPNYVGRSQTGVTLAEQEPSNVSNAKPQYGYVVGTGDGTPTNWQDETTFDNLAPGTTYTFYTCYPETDYYNEAISAGTEITTLTADGPYQLPSGETITLVDGTKVANQNGVVTVTKSGSEQSAISIALKNQYDSVTVDTHGNVTVSGDAEMVTGNGLQISVKNAVFNVDGSMTICSGGSVTMRGAGRYELEVSLPADGSSWTFDPQNSPITIPAGNSVRFGYSPEFTADRAIGADLNEKTLTVPAGTVATMPDSWPGTTTITFPKGNETVLSADEYNNTAFPAGTVVQTGDCPSITLGELGGTIQSGGSVRLPGGGTVVIGSEPETAITAPVGEWTNCTISPNGDEMSVWVDTWAHDEGTSTTIETGEGVEISLGGMMPPTPITIDKSGNVTIELFEPMFVDDSVPVTVTKGDVSVALTPNGEDYPRFDGSVTIHPDGSMNIDGSEWNSNPLDAVVTDPDGNTVTVTLPLDGGEAAVTEDGLTAPGGSTYTDNGTTITIGDKGGTVAPDGSLTMTDGGSAAVGGVTVTAPENGTGTVDVTETGTTVSAGMTVQSGGKPAITVGSDATVDPETGVVTLPENGSVTVGDTTITAPSGGTVTPNESGDVTVPAGSEVTTGDTSITVGEAGGTVKPSTGAVTPNDGGSVTVGDTTITPPKGEAVTPDGNGNVIVPDNSTDQTGDGPAVTVGDNNDGTTINPETGDVALPNGGSVTVGSGESSVTITTPDGGTVKPGTGAVTPSTGGSVTIGGTTITPPTGEAVTPDGNGNVIVPDNSTVQTGDGPAITVSQGTTGATVGTDGSVNLPANGSATVGNTEITVPNGGTVTPNESGDVTVPAGSEVTTGGTTITAPDGGTVKPSTGAVTPNDGGSVTVGGTTITPPKGGSVTPNGDGNVLIPGGSTVTTGGSTVTIPEEGGTLDPGGEVVYTVTVTFDSTGGSEVQSQDIDVNTPVNEPEAPTRSGYSFAGWYTESGERWNFCSPVTGDMTLCARWSMNNIPDTYDIEVVPGEGGSVRPNLYNSSAGATIKLTVTPDEGFELAYITVDGKRISGTSFTMPAHDVTVRAYFTRSGAGLPFTDVNSADWFYDAVSYVVSNGLMEGVSGTEFAPNATMSRAMVWAILARIDGETVTGANWIDTARTWAMANGVSDGTDPNGNVTREQLATMLWRYAGEPASSYSLAAFTDAGSVGDYAATAMAWAVENGIITGMTDTTLAPQGTATRAQCAAMLMRFVENV